MVCSSSPELGNGDSKGHAPTGCVVGRSQDSAERTSIPFILQPCDKDGSTLDGPAREMLSDLGKGWGGGGYLT